MNILYYTPGNSCLYLSENEIWDKKWKKDWMRFDDYFITSEKLLQNLKKFGFKLKKIDDFILIILNKEFECDITDYKIKKTSNVKIKMIYFPILNSLFNTLIEEKQIPDKIYFFATKQKNKNSQDTYFLAKIMKLYLEKINKEKLIEFSEKFSVEDIIAIEENPSNYKKMSEFFVSFFENKEIELKCSYHYMQFSAGTAQIQQGLNLILKNYDTTYYYIQRKKTKADNLLYIKKVNENGYIEILKNLIMTYNYSASIEYMKNTPLKKYKNVILMLKFLYALQNYNYNEIFNLKEEATDDIKKRQFKKLFDEAEEILNQNSDEIAYKHMFEKLEIKVKTKDKLAIIIDVVTIMDNLRWYLLENNPVKPIKFSFSKEEKLKEFNEFVGENTELVDFLEDKNRKLPIKYENNLSAKTITEINKFYYKIGVDEQGKNIYEENFQLYLNIEKELEKNNFLDIRNRIIHTFISDLNDFPYEGGMNKLLEDMKELLISYNFIKENALNSFDKYNEIIRKIIKVNC